MKKASIGIFDSGIGGLTVAKEIINFLPSENIIYLGDTARVPYGTRGKEIITSFALEMAKFLLDKKVKVLVVACNTISATSLSEIEKISPVPVIGVIKPTIYEAVVNQRAKNIGVIGTRATVGSGVYEKEAKILSKKVNVTTKACPLFVPLIEEGLLNHPATKIIALDYLKIFKSKNLDALILGCTHYPLLKNVIGKIAGKNISIIDSARPVAYELKKLLKRKNMLAKNIRPRREFYVTDAPERVYQVANLFFNNKFPGKLEKVKIGM